MQQTNRLISKMTYKTLQLKGFFFAIVYVLRVKFHAIDTVKFNIFLYLFKHTFFGHFLNDVFSPFYLHERLTSTSTTMTAISQPLTTYNAKQQNVLHVYFFVHRCRLMVVVFADKDANNSYAYIPNANSVRLVIKTKIFVCCFFFITQ